MNGYLMATVTIDNPAEHKRAKVDQDGRVFIGRDYAGEQVRVTMEVINNE